MLSTVTDIHIAPASRLPMKRVESVDAEAGAGLVGDRHHGTRHRHVTVQSQTGLDQAGEALGAPVELEVVRVAAPCTLLDDVIGRGARKALPSGRPSSCSTATHPGPPEGSSRPRTVPWSGTAGS